MKAVLFGPYIGEFGWEICRFSPFAIWYKKNLPNIKLIILTRESSFDLYGIYGDIFIPLTVDLPNDIRTDCHGISSNNKELLNICIDRYYQSASKFYEEIKKLFIIENHFFPKIHDNYYKIRWQFPIHQTDYDFRPRKENIDVLLKFLDYNKNKNRKFICLAPRYRKNVNRNWPYWEQFYDILYSKILEDSDFRNNHNFIIISKEPDYYKLPDKLISIKREDNTHIFYDLNNVIKDKNISHSGLAIESIKMSLLTVGSISSLPVLSLLLGTPVLSWGVQKDRHTINTNPFQTPITFFEDESFKLEPEKLFNEMILLIYRKKEYEFFDKNLGIKIKSKKLFDISPDCADIKNRKFFSI